MARNIQSHLKKNKDIFYNFNIEKKYNLNFELHKSMFLIDLLKDHYEFTNQDQIVKIFQKKNSKGNIQEEVSIEQLIHFLQIEFVKYIESNINIYHHNHQKYMEGYTRYQNCFGRIEDIQKIVENIKYLNIENHKKNTNKIIRCESDSSSSDEEFMEHLGNI